MPEPAESDPIDLVKLRRIEPNHAAHARARIESDQAIPQRSTPSTSGGPASSRCQAAIRARVRHARPHSRPDRVRIQR